MPSAPSRQAVEALERAKVLQAELVETRRLALRAIKLSFGLAPAVLLACLGIHIAG